MVFKSDKPSKPSEVDALRHLPLPPPKDFDVSSLAQGCIKTFFLSGKVRTTTKEQAEIARFCLKNKQPRALAWLFLKLEEVSPGKQQSLQLAHVDDFRPGLNEKDTAFLAEWLKAWLDSLPLLRAVDLSNNSVGKQGAKALAELLSTNLPLHHLKVSNCRLSPQSTETIATAVVYNTSLLSLDISSSACNAAGAVALGRIVEKNETLEALDVSHMHLPENLSHSEFIRPIAAGIERSTSLRHFGCARISMSDELIRAIQSNNSLTSINLNRTTGAGHHTSPELLTALCDHLSLKRVHFCHNSLRKADPKTLCRLIRKPVLEMIDLSNCALHTKAWKELLIALRESPSVRHIDLSGNNMNGQGKAIATLLNGNDKLRSVRMANTRLSSNDVDAIELAVDHNHSLRELDLSRNDAFPKRQDRPLQARLLLNRRSHRAKLNNAANALHMLVNRENSHHVPPDLTKEIVRFLGAMGPEGIASLDQLTATVGGLPALKPSE
jgi:Ran GTPase-activating protein (RanGAP) involved in mRNA processing and transport